MLHDKLPRCRGFWYVPRLRSCSAEGKTIWWVEQKGFWMRAAITGPVRATEKEAVRAWRRLVQQIQQKPPRHTPGGRPTARPATHRGDTRRGEGSDRGEQVNDRKGTA